MTFSCFCITIFLYLEVVCIMENDKYNLAFAKVNQALANECIDDIVVSIEEYYKVWFDNEMENKYYHMSDFRDVARKLAHFADSKFVNEVMDSEIYKMISPEKLCDIVEHQAKTLSVENFIKAQNDLINYGDGEILLKLLELDNVDFEKIQATILKGNDTKIMAKLALKYKDVADITSINARVSEIYRGARQPKKRKMVESDFNVVRELYAEYKAKMQDLYEENRYKNTLSR